MDVEGFIGWDQPEDVEGFIGWDQPEDVEGFKGWDYDDVEGFKGWDQPEDVEGFKGFTPDREQPKDVEGFIGWDQPEDVEGFKGDQPEDVEGFIGWDQPEDVEGFKGWDYDDVEGFKGWDQPEDVEGFKGFTPDREQPKDVEGLKDLTLVTAIKIKDKKKVPASNLKTSQPTSQEVPPSPCLSFLSSLSDVKAGLPCHPDALIYKEDFQNRRDELANKLYSLYNKEIFKNQLPAKMLIVWNTRRTVTSGYCYLSKTYDKDLKIPRSCRLEFSTKVINCADRLRDTMIHELCHAATWIIDAVKDGHGLYWKAWAKVANQTFAELPEIKRCHSYDLEMKYTYKCAGCGYRFGRNSKSLDIKNRRCGYCYGIFQLLD